MPSPNPKRREYQIDADNSSMLVAEGPLAKFGDLVFPRRCVVCDCEANPADSLLICDGCQTKISRGNRPACRRCASTRIQTTYHTTSKNQQNEEPQDCPKCRGEKFYFDSAFSLGDYETVLRKVIVEMKHPGQETLIIQMGRLMGETYRKTIESLSVDFVVAMPSFWTRHFSRGVNVSALLCEGLSLETDLNVHARLLKQVRGTRKQGTLTRGQRLNNVKNAFKVRGSFDTKGLRLLIVDDVMSSGATINEASRILKASGAASVHALVVARGMGSF